MRCPANAPRMPRPAPTLGQAANQATRASRSEPAHRLATLPATCTKKGVTAMSSRLTSITHHCRPRRARSRHDCAVLGGGSRRRALHLEPLGIVIQARPAKEWPSQAPRAVNIKQEGTKFYETFEDCTSRGRRRGCDGTHEIWTIRTVGSPRVAEIRNVYNNECLDGRLGTGNVTLQPCGFPGPVPDGAHEYWQFLV